MDKAKISVPILCPNHAGQPLVRANPDPTSPKHVYCFECLIQSEDPKALYASFPKITEFVTHAAATFAEHKSQIRPVLEVPKEFLDVAARQGESLEKLSKHVSEEKKKIEIFFEHITNGVMEAISKLKNGYLEILDKQVSNLHENYTAFEKMLKRMYPKKEEIDLMFLEKEDLQMNLEEIDNALDLEEFVKDLKQTINVNRKEISMINHEAKENYFRYFGNRLKEIESKKLLFIQNSPERDIKEEITKQLSQLLRFDKAFTLNNCIPTDMLKPEYLCYSQSYIINPQEFLVLKDWIPENMKFNPKLLYRMTRDGRNNKKLHSLVDNEGPTITLIRCKYENAAKSSIIGGFLDKDVSHEKTQWINSDQAFIFSMTPQIKCPVRQHTNAAYVGPNHEVFFGYNGTIGVRSNFAYCNSQINSNQTNNTYENCEKIIPPECYKGLDKEHSFELEELEVYAVY